VQIELKQHHIFLVNFLKDCLRCVIKKAREH